MYAFQLSGSGSRENNMEGITYQQEQARAEYDNAHGKDRQSNGVDARQKYFSAVQQAAEAFLFTGSASANRRFCRLLLRKVSDPLLGLLVQSNRLTKTILYDSIFRMPK